MCLISHVNRLDEQGKMAIQFGFNEPADERINTCPVLLTSSANASLSSIVHTGLLVVVLTYLDNILNNWVDVVPN